MKNKSMRYILSIFCLITYSVTAYSKDTVNIESNIPEKEQQITSLILEAKRKSLNNPEEARQTYLKALDIDENCDICYYDIANLYARANMFEKSYEMAKKAYDLDSANYWYILTYARLSSQNRDFEISKNLYTKLLDRNKQKREAWLSLAISYDELGDSKKSLSILDSMETKLGKAGDASYLKHNLYIKQGDWEKAIAEAEFLLEESSGDVRYATLLADSYENNGNKEKAIEYYNEAIKINPNFFPALIGKAESYRKSADFPTYFSTLNTVFANNKINPAEKAEYLRLVLEIPSFSRHFAKNIDTLFAISASVHPTSPEIKYIQAMYFSQINRINESISLLRTNISLNEKDQNSWYMLMSIFSGLKKWTDLNTSTEKAIELFPNNYVFYQNRAVALLNLNDRKSAIAVLNKALDIKEMKEDTRATIHTFIGDLYGEEKAHKKAYKEYQEALKYNPNNAMALNNYAYFLSLNGKSLDLAYDMSKKSLEIDGSNTSFLDTFAYILFLQKKYNEAKVIFRQAMSLGGKDSCVVLDHYADTLFKLGEYSTAEIYWSQALDKEDCVNKKDIEKKLNKLKKLN